MKFQEYIQTITKTINDLQNLSDKLKTDDIVQALITTKDAITKDVLQLLAQCGIFPIPKGQAEQGDLVKKYLMLQPEAYQKLYYLMQDALSRQTVENAVDILLYLTPPQKYENRFLYSPLFLRTKFDVAFAEMFQKMMPDLVRKYPDFHIAPETFLAEHGLLFLNDCVKDYIRGGVFLDCGALDGGSSVVMSQYSPKKILVFEPSEKNMQLTKENLKRVGLESTCSFQPVCLGAKKGTTYFNGNLGGSSRITTEINDNVQEVEIDTVDNLCKANNITDVRWIKADLEGEAKNMIVGAEQIIKRDKPLLSLAVYHNPEEFFEIAPLLREWVPEYQFAMRHPYTYLYPDLLLFEETLIAYCPRPNDPKEWYDSGRFPPTSETALSKE